MSKDPAGQRKVVRASGIKRRKQILEATLRVIIRDGIRGVRHRAVAEEAQVPLASTTYYFKDIEELLSETFLFWNHSANTYTEQFRDQIFAQLENVSTDDVKEQSARIKLGNIFSELAIAYVISQIKNHREDRLIELAFHHEAVRSEKLRRVVRGSLNGQRESLVLLYQLIGSQNPDADAQVTISVLLRLEQEAVMADDLDHDKIAETIRRHINMMFLAVGTDSDKAHQPDRMLAD